MNVLYRVEELREAVMDVLGDASSNRYAIVAFVGRHPLRWLRNPKGLQVFCWPRAGGTNPEGIDALVNAGVTVHFKESLHSKVYHSDSRGTVIGSANLSDNALGSGRLTETAVKLPPGAFSIDEQLTLLEGAVRSGTRAFNGMLDTLRREHVAYYQRNPGQFAGSAAPEELLTFRQWAERDDHVRSPWQLGLWSGSDGPPQDAVDQFQRTANTPFSNWRAHHSESNIEVGVATLDCQYFADKRGRRKQGALWWFPEAAHLSGDPAWEERPHLWFAKVDVPAGVSVPFDCSEPRFLNALDRVIAKFPDEIDELEGPVSPEFVELLLAEYNDGHGKSGRSELGNDVLEAIFRVCQQVDRGEISLRQGTDDLVDSYGLNRNSAIGTIRSVRHMLHGERYRRTLTIQVTNYVLTNINEQYGSSGLRRALEGLAGHIHYLASLGTNAPGLQKVFDTFSEKSLVT